MVEKVGICKRCKRKLINPEHIKIGYGPICYSKLINNSHYKPLFKKDEVKNDGKNTNK